MKDRKRRIIKSINNCKHYIKEAVLVYLPYSENLNCFISSFCEVFTEKEEVIGRLEITVEDEQLEGKIMVFEERFGKLIGNLNDLLLDGRNGVYILSYKNLNAI